MADEIDFKEEDIQWDEMPGEASQPKVSPQKPFSQRSEEERNTRFDPITKKRIKTNVRPDYSMGMNPLELAAAGAGLTFGKKYRGLTGQPEEPGQAAIDKMLLENPSARFGAILPDALGGMVVPSRVIPQALFAATSSAIEPGKAEERFARALRSGLGAGAAQGVASGIIRGANALYGRQTAAGLAAREAEKRGLNLSAGDILNSNVLREFERATFKSPTANQGEQIAAMMKDVGDNPVSNAVSAAYGRAQSKVSDAAAFLDNAITTNPKIPKVLPKETASALREIKELFPESFNQIANNKIRQQLSRIADTPKNITPKMTFSDVKDLAQAIGPIENKLEAAAAMGQVGPGVGKDVARSWSKLYGSLMNDLESWGGKAGAPEDVLTAYKGMKDTFKNEVLPFRENPISNKIINEKYIRPEDIIRDVTSPRNRTLLNELSSQLDQSGQNTINAINAAKRGTNEFVKGEGKATGMVRPMSAAALMGGTAVGAPYLFHSLPALGTGLGIVGGEQALIHGLNSPWGKALIGGSPNMLTSELLNRALYGGLRGGLEASTSEAMMNRANQE